MFHGGGPPAGRYPRQYAPSCRVSNPFDQPQGPSMATGFGPRTGPVPFNPPPTPRPFMPPQYERHPFPQFYPGSSEECQRSSAGRSYPSPGPGNSHGLCGGPPGENIGRQLNPSLPCAGFAVDQTQLSIGSQFPDFRQVNPPSQEDIENERAGEAFLRCLANKEKYALHERAVDRGDPHCRPSCPANGPGQQLSAARPRSRSRSRGKSMGRSKSRPRSRSRSRGKSMARSKSRPRSRSRSRGKNMGRSKSQPRSRSRSRGKSVGRSKSRPPSPSLGRSVGRSKSRPRSRSRSRGKSPGKSCIPRMGRDPSRSCSGTSTSSSSSSNSNSIAKEGASRIGPPSKKTAMDMFRELLLAGQLKEREELLTSSKMAALKKHLDNLGHSQASPKTSPSPMNILGEHKGSSLPRETQSFLSAVTKGVGPSLFASLPRQMREQSLGQMMQVEREDLNTGHSADVFGSIKQETEEENVGDCLLPHERVRHDSSGFSRILGGMGNVPDLQKKKLFVNIDDEEEFLYGDEDDKGKVAAKTVAGEKQAVVDFDKIKKALTTIGLDLGKAEISKMMARTQEHQTSRSTESPHHKGTSSSGGLSPSQSHKLNRSPNPEGYSNSHSSVKQGLFSGAPASLARSEIDTSTQEKQTGEIPFFSNVSQPLMTTNMQSSPLGSESESWGKTQPNMANYWPQNPNIPPDVDLRMLGLGPLRQVLEAVKATTKATGQDKVVDPTNQNARVTTGQKNFEGIVKVKEEHLKTDMQEKLERKDYLLKELESLLKQEVSEFVVPVIGFCCQLCEEFFGDVTSAQDHATCQSHREKCKKHVRAHKKSGGNLQVRPIMDTDRRSPRETQEHKWISREESKGYRGVGEKLSVKEDKVDITRPAKVLSGSSSAMSSKTAKRKGSDSPKSAVTDHGEDRSSKARKKKKKEKKRLKKEKKKEKKKERKERD